MLCFVFGGKRKKSQVVTFVPKTTFGLVTRFMNPKTNEGLGALEFHLQAEAPVTVTVLGDTEVRPSSPRVALPGANEGFTMEFAWSLR